MKRFIVITLILAIAASLTSCENNRRRYRIKSVRTRGGTFTEVVSEDKGYKIGDTLWSESAYIRFNIITDTLQ